MGRIHNKVIGEMSGIQAGTITGGITFNGRTGEIQIGGFGDDGDSDVVNEVIGDMSGIQVGRVINEED